MNSKEIIKKWNDAADEFNQWDLLSEDERIEFIFNLGVEVGWECGYEIGWRAGTDYVRNVET